MIMQYKSFNSTLHVMCKGGQIMAAGIVDNKDIFDIGEYLNNKEKEIKSMDHLLGPELFTIHQLEL